VDAISAVSALDGSLTLHLPLSASSSLSLAPRDLVSSMHSPLYVTVDLRPLYVIDTTKCPKM
jgi:hypothetical protein